MGVETGSHRVAEDGSYHARLLAALVRFEAAVAGHARARGADHLGPTPATRKALGDAEAELELAAGALKELVKDVSVR